MKRFLKCFLFFLNFLIKLFFKKFRGCSPCFKLLCGSVYQVLQQCSTCKPTPRQESDYIKRIYFILFIIALIGCLPTATAISGSCQPYNLTVTSKYVSSISVCSCGCGEYAYEKHTFLNYCPACHHHGTLSYSKACWGGQWTCSHCDADYCCQCGKEKISGTDLWLTPCTVKPVISQNNTTTNTTQDMGVKESKPNLFDLVKANINIKLLNFN